MTVDFCELARRLRDRDQVLPWLMQHGLDDAARFAAAIAACADPTALMRMANLVDGVRAARVLDLLPMMADLGSAAAGVAVDFDGQYAVFARNPGATCDFIRRELGDLLTFPALLRTQEAR